MIAAIANEMPNPRSVFPSLELLLAVDEGVEVLVSVALVVGSHSAVELLAG